MAKSVGPPFSLPSGKEPLAEILIRVGDGGYSIKSTGLEKCDVAMILALAFCDYSVTLGLESNISVDVLTNACEQVVREMLYLGYLEQSLEKNEIGVCNNE